MQNNKKGKIKYPKVPEKIGEPHTVLENTRKYLKVSTNEKVQRSTKKYQKIPKGTKNYKKKYYKVPENAKRYKQVQESTRKYHPCITPVTPQLHSNDIHVKTLLQYCDTLAKPM